MLGGGGRGGGGGGGGCVCLHQNVHDRSRMNIDPCIPTMQGRITWTFSPTWQTSLALSAKRREEFGGVAWRVGFIPVRTACEANLHIHGWMPSSIMSVCIFPDVATPKAIL